jgi:hypothetical protein
MNEVFLTNHVTMEWISNVSKTLPPSSRAVTRMLEIHYIFNIVEHLKDFVALCYWERFRLYKLYEICHKKCITKNISVLHTVYKLRSGLTPHNVVVGYQCFRSSCCLHSQGSGGSMNLWDVGIVPQCYTVSQPRRPQLESSLPWKPHILHKIYISFICSICKYNIYLVICVGEVMSILFLIRLVSQ